jgi:hypothetical protein
MATVQGIKKLGRLILTAYPEAKLDLSNDLDAQLWQRLLINASDEEILEAFAEHVRRGNRFAPNAGEISAICSGSGGVHMLPGSNVPDYIRKHIEAVKEWLARNPELPEKQE